MRGGMAIVNMGVAADARTGTFQIARSPVTPFKRERLPANVDPALAQVLHRMQEATHDATHALRQIPEGNVRTYFKDVSFVSGVNKTLDHLLGVSGSVATAFPTPRSASPIALDPEQIRFEVLNQRVVAGACFRVSVDAKRIVLRPNATFTADVRLFVVP